MDFVIKTIGGGEFLYDILNGIVLTVNSPLYLSIIHGIILTGLLFNVMKTAVTGTYMETIKWGLFCYLVFMMALTPKVTVIIEDRANNSIPNIIGNVPIGLAFPASLISNLDTEMAEMFDTNFTPVGDIAYTNSGMLFGSGIVDAITKTGLSGVVEMNFREFVRQCVYDQVMLGNIKKEELQRTTNLYGVLLNPNNHSNIFYVTYLDGTGNGIDITCKDAATRLKTDLDSNINKISLKFAELMNPSLYHFSSGNALNKTDSQIQDVNEYLLSASKSSIDTMKQAVLMQGFIDGMNARMSLADSANPYAVAKAKLTQRESWKVIGANAPNYVLILKIFIQVLLYALFPIVIVMCMAGIFGFSMILEYFKAMFALALISPMFAILNRISYGYTSYKLTALTNSDPALADAGMNLGNIIKIQEFNSDIMAFSGYLSIMLVPMAFSITQRGFAAIGHSIGHAMEGIAISNAGASANEAVSGNYSLGNTSIGNDSLYNSSKFNISEYNASRNNVSNDNLSIGNESINNLSRDNASFNNISGNKHDTSGLQRHGFTVREDAYGSMTTDNATGANTGLRINTVDSLVQKHQSYGEENSRGIQESKHFGAGVGVGSRGSSGISNAGNGTNNDVNEEKGIASKVVDGVKSIAKAASFNIDGGYNESLTKTTSQTSGVSVVDRREEQAENKATIQGAGSAKDAISALNGKNEIQSVGQATAPVIETTDKAVQGVKNFFKVDPEFSKELDEFAKSKK